MTVPQIVAAELRRLVATPMSRLALLALGIVPLLYGGVYLWANHDPYGSLDEVPVALVVADEGADTDDGEQNVGEEVADTLVDDASFDWQRMSSREAAAALDAGDVAFILELPASFTADLLSAEDPDPTQASIELTTSDATGALTATMGETAASEVRESVVEQVGEEAASQLLIGISDIRDGMVEAYDGASQLASGLSDADDGATELADGAAELAQGASQLDAGAGQLADGTSQLASGSSELAGGLATMQQQTASLPDQTAQLASGAQQVADGNAQIATIGDDVAGVTSELAADVPGARADIVSRLEAAGLTQEEIDQVLVPLDDLGGAIVDGDGRVQEANGQLQTLAAGAQEVADGASSLAGASVTLVDGIDDAAAGASQLASGAAQADDAAGQLAAGAGELDSGAQQLASGANELAPGIGRLLDGAVELRDGLRDGVDEIPATTTSEQEAQASQIADSAGVDQDLATDVGSYGARLAPFFATLAAWIGIYALMLITKPASSRAITALRSPVKVGIGAWLTPALLGAAQMLALFGILVVVLQFPVALPAQALGILLLASASFAAILVALNIWLGSVGQFLGLVLMVLQLVTAGGTFPWQTLPGPLEALHHVLPMSASVEALRQAMTGGSVAVMGGSALQLALWGVVALAAIVVGVWRQMDHRTMRDLQPSLIG